MAKILIVEDDSGLSATLEALLTRDLFVVEIIDDGLEAIEVLKAFDYDLLILDWSLPGCDGIEVMRSYRLRGGKAPILMLTGKDAVRSKIQGLDSGADDYITKPFHPDELAARVRALLRRVAVIPTVLSSGSVELDPVKHVVTKEGKEVSLQPIEFSLLEFLMRHPNEIFSSEELLRHVWMSEDDASIDAIYTCIGRIRKKLDAKGEESIIKTVHSVGYTLRKS